MAQAAASHIVENVGRPATLEWIIQLGLSSNLRFAPIDSEPASRWISWQIILDSDCLSEESINVMSTAHNFHHQSEKPTSIPRMSTKFVSGLVSVIIPTFNRKEMVQEALASVVQQTWTDIEIIVIDDGSTDGTFELLRIWQVDNPEIASTILRQENAGVATARNSGLANAKGEFLYMLDSDDLIFPDALETLVTTLSAGNYPYSLGHIHNADQKGRILVADKSGISKQSEQNILSNQWMTHAALYKRSTLAASGLFNNSLVVGEDTEFQWRVFAKMGLGFLTSQYIGLRRHHPFGHLSLNRTDMQSLKHSLQAQLAFRQWIKAEYLEIQKINFRQRVAIFSMVIRFGSTGDWKSKDDAISLFDSATNQTARKLNFPWIIGRPNWRPYYHFLLSIYVGAKGIVEACRFIRSLRYCQYCR